MSSPSHRQITRHHAPQQSHLMNKRETMGGGIDTVVDGKVLRQQLLLPFFKMIADVVPGPPYELITDMEKFIACISMFEAHDLPESMISDHSPFKQFDVARRVNSIRKSTKEPALAKRLRMLVTKWRGDAASTAESKKPLLLNGNATAPTVADTLHMRLASATSSPAASTTNPYSPLANGVALRSGVVSPAAVSEQKVSPLKIKKFSNIKPESTKHLNGGEVLSNRRQLQSADSSYYIVEQSNKRRIGEESTSTAVAVRSPVADATVATVEPASKKRRTRPIRKRRIDLSDDEETDDDAGVDNNFSTVPALSVPPPSSLKQQLTNMLESLPPLFKEAQQSAAAQFAVFYAEQVRDADVFREQQEKRLADEAAARAAAEAAASDLVLRSPYRVGGGYGGPGGNIDAVINFNDNDDDDDDFSFGIGPTTSTPNKQPLTANTSGYLSAEAATMPRPSFPHNRILSPVLANETATLVAADVAMPDAVQGSAKDSEVGFALQPSQISQALTAEPPLNSSRNADEISGNMDVADTEDGFMQAVAAVDDKFLFALHTQNVAGCNGNYDAEHRWHDFTEGYVTRRNDGKRIGVAPYVVLD